MSRAHSSDEVSSSDGGRAVVGSSSSVARVGPVSSALDGLYMCLFVGSSSSVTSVAPVSSVLEGLDM